MKQWSKPTLTRLVYLPGDWRLRHIRQVIQVERFRRSAVCRQAMAVE